jgi:hypothetical protein
MGIPRFKSTPRSTHSWRKRKHWWMERALHPFFVVVDPTTTSEWQTGEIND